MNGFTLGLDLKRRLRATQKWAIIITGGIISWGKFPYKNGGVTIGMLEKSAKGFCRCVSNPFSPLKT